MHRLLLISTFAVSGFAARAAEPPALMPLPLKLEAGAGALGIDQKFTVAATLADPRLESALNRLVARLSRQTGMAIPRGKPAPGRHATLRVECAARGALYPTLGENESYRLEVSPVAALLKAATVDGALRGLETFAQLVQPGAGGFEAPAVGIDDQPRFPWRGLLMDVSRHWMPVEVVERNLDAMAAVKLNVFHWHLSDDQGFRVESKRYPRLQQFGSGGHYYTQAEIRAVVAYARERGIRVVPEFDMPGHTLSWFPGYPRLAGGPGPFEIGGDYGIYDPVMDPSREETYAFLDGFVGEMATLFPDPYFHVGGDEVNGRQWTQSARIKAFAKQHRFKDARHIQLYFSQRIRQILARHGKTMVGWDEILQPGLGSSTVIETWRGRASLAESVRQGYRGILSWGYYLDHLSPASFHYGIEPLAGDAAQLTPAQVSHILGGEACMWAELVSAETVDSRIWPRLAAIAERLWSAQDVTDVDSMYRRLEAVSRMLEWTGIQHRSNYVPMLDRLSGNHFAPPVRVLADACEALGLGPRHVDRITTETPFNRMVDAAHPESESVRALELAAARVAGDAAANAADAADLRAQFTRWADNDRDFEPLAEANSLLEELKPISRDLSAVGALGLRLLDIAAAGQAPPPDWLAAQDAELKRMLEPNADLRLAAVRPVRILLDRAAGAGK
ncbi:MAG TPA: family 20 glycosylhydrolase [Bryobacteraceae bacterium]|jgi:hexosaminidase